MVVRLLTLLPFLWVSVAQAVTPEELRAMTSEQENNNNARANRAQTGNMQSLIPAPAAGAQAPASTAPAATTDGAGTATGTPRGASGGSRATSGTSINPSTAAISSDAVAPSTSYGVRLGTWMSAKLTRNISSAEIGQIEITLSTNVVGDKRTLPAGSILFCVQSLNAATKRLDLVATHGITPEGREFKLKAIAYDPARVAGLPGIVELNKNALASHSAAKGITAALGAVGSRLAGTNPLATAGAAATQTALNDTNPALEYNTAPTAVIYVAPQDLLVRVEEQF